MIKERRLPMKKFLKPIIVTLTIVLLLTITIPNLGIIKPLSDPPNCFQVNITQLLG